MSACIYESIPDRGTDKPCIFEIQQSMKDKALTRASFTSLCVRPVIIGYLCRCWTRHL